ncbi:Amino acid permease-associated region [Sinomonas atrocyanea]|uniref:Amino acid permease-associated region n=1 Tax=Sinomonas atrocyanea TaxID=37927 RepID=A0A127A4E4_9MICC|nr:amino acid permease [Sinomonas atrocyanea]AMM34193.1 Amino acid permease-associated region [Sinomonas atrocyanea]GEB64862.1 amino acid permease [Sinomonas atrocyanea]GGG75202.1 amino acid permease [Sinomonas atrocyanea]
MSADTAAPTAAAGTLGRVRSLAYYLGAVLGTGVIALPALSYRAAGPASLLAWAGLVLASVPIAWTFASLGRRLPDAGGVSTYVRRAFGDYWATASGWWFYLTIPFGIPASALFAGQYAAHALGAPRWAALAAAGGITAAVLGAVWAGVRTSSTIQLVLAGTILAVVILAVAAGLTRADASRLEPFAAHGWSAVAPSAALIVWAFAGWEAMSYLGGQFRNPERDLGVVTALALALVGTLYLAFATVSVLALGDAAGGDAPLAALLGYALGPVGEALTAALAVVLTVGTLTSYATGAAELGRSLGQTGSLPRWFGRGRNALVAVTALSTAGLGVLGAGTDTTEVLVRLVTAAIVSVYVAGLAAALRLLPGRGQRAVAAAGLAAVAAIAATCGWYLAWPAALGAGAALWSARGRRGAARTG